MTAASRRCVQITEPSSRVRAGSRLLEHERSPGRIDPQHDVRTPTQSGRRCASSRPSMPLVAISHDVGSIGVRSCPNSNGFGREGLGIGPRPREERWTPSSLGQSRESAVGLCGATSHSCRWRRRSLRAWRWIGSSMRVILWLHWHSEHSDVGGCDRTLRSTGRGGDLGARNWFSSTLLLTSCWRRRHLASVYWHVYPPTISVTGAIESRAGTAARRLTESRLYSGRPPNPLR